MSAADELDYPPGTPAPNLTDDERYELSILHEQDSDYRYGWYDDEHKRSLP